MHGFTPFRLQHIDHAYGFLGEIIRTRSTADWLAPLGRVDIPAARMYSIDDILADPHLAETGYLQHVTHPSEGEMLDTAIPTEWSHSVPERRHHAPRLGEDTVQILREFGYAEEEIQELLSDAAIQSEGARPGSTTKVADSGHAETAPEPTPDDARD